MSIKGKGTMKCFWAYLNHISRISWDDKEIWLRVIEERIREDDNRAYAYTL